MTDALVLVWSGTSFKSSNSSGSGSSNNLIGTNMTVDWGDGTTGTITSGTRFTHSYSSNGTYVITITGNSITKLGVRCFYNCTGLKRIIIPSSITHFDQLSLQGCTNLETIIFTRNTPPQVSYTNVFGTTFPTSCKIYVPNSSYKSASNYPSSSTHTYIINTVGELCDKVHPIGSIYQTTSSTHPSLLFGGAWKQIKDRFLLAVGSTYANGSTGGEATHTLTESEMPSHNHSRSTTPQSWAERVDGSQVISAVWANSANMVTKTSNATGGGAAHNNMPPYLAVYIWERIG